MYSYRQYAEHALTAAMAASNFLRGRLGKTARLEDARKDFVTREDREAQNLIREILSLMDPSIPFFGEEDLGEARANGLLWVIDPWDGTVNGYYGDGASSVSIALVKNSRTVAAALSFVNEVLHVWGTETQAVCDKEKMASFTPHVNREASLKKARVFIDPGKGDPSLFLSLFGKLCRATTYPKVPLCATGGLMSVALGKISGYVLAPPEPFDIAAACLIVERAGGMVTDIEGHPWTPFSKSIVATNGRVHEELLITLNR